MFSFRILPFDQNREDWDCSGVEWDVSGHNFFCSVADMECDCFCEGETKLLECINSECWGRV